MVSVPGSIPDVNDVVKLSDGDDENVGDVPEDFVIVGVLVKEAIGDGISVAMGVIVKLGETEDVVKPSVGVWGAVGDVLEDFVIAGVLVKEEEGGGVIVAVGVIVKLGDTEDVNEAVELPVGDDDDNKEGEALAVAVVDMDFVEVCVSEAVGDVLEDFVIVGVLLEGADGDGVMVAVGITVGGQSSCCGGNAADRKMGRQPGTAFQAVSSFQQCPFTQYTLPVTLLRFLVVPTICTAFSHSPWPIIGSPLWTEFFILTSSASSLICAIIPAVSAERLICPLAYTFLIITAPPFMPVLCRQMPPE